MLLYSSWHFRKISSTCPVESEHVGNLPNTPTKGLSAKKDTTPALMMEESIALVKTLNWKIVEPLLIGLPNLERKYLFPAEVLDALAERVQKDLRITAVFVSLYQLRPSQRVELEERLRVPVIDRYSLGEQ
jgi:50S ribosomal subunit-associated GTPase HflX